MLRAFFLYLSAAVWARRVLMALPFATRVSRRFVAGETLDEAIKVTRQLNAKGMMVSLDLLGESVHNEADAARATDEYLALLQKMADTGVKAYASLKLTALGLDVAEELCVLNMRRILTRARELKLFIRIDMEGSAYTEKTLRIFRTLREDYEFSNVGIVIQSYLRRSEQDMKALAAEGASVRLVKGAYKEPAEVAFPDKADVDANYIRLMEEYLSDEARAKGAYLAVATHDDKMLEATKSYVEQHHIGHDQFEFQMLYGVRGSAQEALVAEGYQMRVYVPYGTEWHPYFMRRLAERPANVWFILKNFFRG